jgi:hypothetical protein
LSFIPQQPHSKTYWKRYYQENFKSACTTNPVVAPLRCDLKEGQSYKCNTVGIL